MRKHDIAIPPAIGVVGAGGGIVQQTGDPIYVKILKQLSNEMFRFSQYLNMCSSRFILKTHQRCVDYVWNLTNHFGKFNQYVQL